MTQTENFSSILTMKYATRHMDGTFTDATIKWVDELLKTNAQCDVARITRVSDKTISHWIKAGKVRPAAFSKRRVRPANADDELRKLAKALRVITGGDFYITQVRNGKFSVHYRGNAAV